MTTINTGRDTADWAERAATALLDFAQRVDDFIIEEARLAIEASVGPPKDLRGWGAVTKMALRRKWIVPTGAYRRTTACSNGSPRPVYCVIWGKA